MPLGSTPALKTSHRSPASCRHRASASWLRHELPVPKVRTRFFGDGSAELMEVASRAATTTGTPTIRAIRPTFDASAITMNFSVAPSIDAGLPSIIEADAPGVAPELPFVPEPSLLTVEQ